MRAASYGTPSCVQLSGNLLRRQLIREILDLQYFLFRVGNIQHAIRQLLMHPQRKQLTPSQTRQPSPSPSDQPYLSPAGFLIIYLYSFRQIPINTFTLLSINGSQIRLQHAIPCTRRLAIIPSLTSPIE